MISRRRHSSSILAVGLSLVAATSAPVGQPPTFLTNWGAYGTGNNQFNIPADVAVDASGNVYVVDSSSHRIQKYVWPSPHYFKGEPELLLCR